MEGLEGKEERSFLERSFRARTKSLERNDATPSGLAVQHLFKMAATDAEFWASLETNFSG